MQKAAIGDVHSNQTNGESEIIRQLKEKFSTAGKSENILSCQKAGLSGRFRKEFGFHGKTACRGERCSVNH